MNTQEISSIIVVISDFLSFGILCFFIYNLQKKVDKLEKTLNNESVKKEAVFKVSGADLVGVLSKITKKESEV